jgi:DNA polymerase-1
LQDKERMDAYALQRAAIGPVVAMEARGLGFDQAAHARQVHSWSEDLAKARAQYHTATGEAPPSSAAAVRKWLDTVLSDEQRPEWKLTTKGLLSTEKRALKGLVMGADERIAHTALAILDINHATKLLSSFGAGLVKMVNPITGRLHARFNIAAAKSGRFSCSSPNLQQLPKASAEGFRQCIVAAPGHVLVACDWSQVELRAAAWLAGDGALTARFAEGADLHDENAAMMAGVPVAEVTKAQRSVAKVISFGVLYGMGPAKLALTARTDWGLTMSRDEAAAARQAFFTAYRRVWHWQQENRERCLREGQVTIGCGRAVEAAWEYFGELTYTQCCNLPVQGICADAMLRAIVLAHQRFEQAGLHGGLVASVHDELLAEVPEDEGEQARQLLEASMLEAFELTFPQAPTRNVAKAEVGQSWGKAAA